MPQDPLKNPSDPVARAKALAMAIPVSTVLGTSLIGMNFIQMLSVGLVPFNRQAFRAINRWAGDTWWSWCVSVSEKLNGVEFKYSGDEIPYGENVILVCNHQQMTDITLLMALAKGKGRLGDMKFFVKDVLKYVPGVGWGMFFMGHFFVKRNWNEDRASIEQTFAGILKDSIPVWLISFVEGTRVTPDKIERSQAYAREKGHRETRHVLLPRTKGFVASMAGLRSYVDAVYDVTIGYPEGLPTLWQFVKGHAPLAHMHIRRYPISEMPEDAAELSQWLFDCFVEKDELLDAYYRQGYFGIQK